MDSRTLEAYQRQAETVFSRHTRFDRTTHHERLLPWLRPGEPTADIGSGSGADLAWLVSQGFPVVGFEPVAGLRQLAVARYPELDVRASSLPDLEGVPDGAFGYVICSAVLMHLPLASISPAIASLSRILHPGGRLLLSYRPGKGGAKREEDGRLFTPIDPDNVIDHLARAGIRVILCEKDDHPRQPTTAWSKLLGTKRHYVTRGTVRYMEIMST